MAAVATRMNSTMSRSLLSLRSTPRLRPPSLSSRPRRFSFAPSRSFAELGCTQSFLPFTGVATLPRLTAHLSTDLRAFSELYNGNNGKDG